MNNINVTIELCAEDRARLDNILGALQGLTVTPCIEADAAAPIKALPQEAPAPVQPEQAIPKPVEPAAQIPAEPVAPAPEKTEEAPEVTTAELQSKVVQLVGAGKKDATRAIVLEYAKSVGEIPAEKRAEVLGRLKALEG